MVARKKDVSPLTRSEAMEIARKIGNWQLKKDYRRTYRQGTIMEYFLDVMEYKGRIDTFIVFLTHTDEFDVDSFDKSRLTRSWFTLRIFCKKGVFSFRKTIFEKNVFRPYFDYKEYMYLYSQIQHPPEYGEVADCIDEAREFIRKTEEVCRVS